MAPEVIQHKEYNQQCDIWSTGVIMYLLLSGLTPFYASTNEETEKLILEGKPKYNGK